MVTYPSHSLEPAAWHVLGHAVDPEDPRVRVHDVTSVSDCTEAAAARFESWP